MSDDVRISEAYKLAPNTVQGAGGARITKADERPNPSRRQDLLSGRSIAIRSRAGAGRSRQQKTQDRLTWRSAVCCRKLQANASSGPPRTRGCQRRSPPRLKATAPVAKDLPMVKATQSVSLDATGGCPAGGRDFDGLFAGAAPARPPGEELSSATMRLQGHRIGTHFVGAIPRGAYDDHEAATLEKVLGTQASARLVRIERPLGVLERHLSRIWRPRRRLFAAAPGEDNHDQLANVWRPSTTSRRTWLRRRAGSASRTSG